MKSRKVLFLQGLFIVSMTLFQSKILVAQRIMQVPVDYYNPTGAVLSSSTSDVDKKNNWIVCSDRDNNPTYEKPGGAGEKKNVMSFMETFYVTEEKGEYLHLYKWEEGVRDLSKGNKLNGKAKDYGWAPKDKLLLWLNCLVTPKQLSKKVLPIVKMSTINKNMKDYIDESNQLKIFSDPALTKQNANAIKMFQFLFIYKEVGKNILVGIGNKTNFNRAKYDLLGWIDSDIVQEWSDRVCLEPNWDIDAVNERKQKSVKASLFTKPTSVTAWQSSGFSPQSPIWDEEAYSTVRKEPEWKRFPILEDENGIVKTGYVTGIINSAGQEIITKDEAANAVKKANEKMISLRQINIIFVIDAGSGMTEYLTSVTDAINKILAIRLDNKSSNKIKYGAVVYRDYGDENCSQDLSYAKIDLTPNASSVIEFLNSQKTISGCKKGNKSVNKGLYQALRMLSVNGKQDESNYVVMIGGAGESRPNPKYSNENIINMLVNAKANLLVFQAINGLSDEYTFFTPTFKYIIKEASARSTKKSVIGTKFEKDFSNPRFNTEKENIYFTDYPNTSGLNATIAFPEKSSSLSSDVIVYQMDSLLNFGEQDIEAKIGALNAQVNGVGLRNIKVNPSIIRLFKELGQDINDADIGMKFMGTNYQFFIPAFTTPEIKSLENSVFKRVLFVSIDEFDALLNTLTVLVPDGANSSELRKALKNVYTQLLATYIGDAKAKEQIENKNLTPDDVLKYVTGLHSKTDFLSKFKISDFTKKTIVSDDDIQKMQDEIRNKISGLRQIKQDPDQMLKMDLNTFFWIPEEYLP